MTTERFTLAQSEQAAGCWHDGHHGQYIYDAIVADAIYYGFTADDLNVRDAEGNLTDYGIELSDEAISWMNEHIAHEDYSFGWNDGEFFYMPLSWWCECEDEFDNDPDSPEEES